MAVTRAKARPAARGRPAGTWWQRHQAWLTPALMLAPAVILFTLFVLYPIAASIRLSFYRWDGLNPAVWLGVDNYRELFHDRVFYTALVNNLTWLLLYGLAPLAGLALAIFVSQAVPGIRLVRSLFFLPFVLSQVVVGLIFSRFLSARFGLLNEVLQAAGLSPVAPLDSERGAIVAVIAAGLWPQTAYCTILYLTGLTAIRGELVDAARMDGANGLTLLQHVIIPQLRPVTFIVAMVSTVGALRSFDLVMIMTGGGPYNSSSVLAQYMYEQTFVGFRYGYGAAVATVLFVTMASCVGFFLWRLLRREAT